MAVDVKVVVPSDIGNTIKMGAKTPNKYDVDVSALELPQQLTGLQLRGTRLVANTTGGDKEIDLAPMLPQVVLDTVLKKVEKRRDNLVFTVGNKDNDDANKELTVSVASLLPVVSDGETIDGVGVEASKLSVKILSSADNLLKKADGGLTVSKSEIQALVSSAPSAAARTIRLVNASGQTVVGYIHDTEQ